MNEGFVSELKALLSTGFTGTLTLHVCEGAVKQYELSERRRPKAERVELTEDHPMTPAANVSRCELPKF